MSTKTKGRKSPEAKLHIVDVSNWLNRAYYAGPPLTTSSGFPTGALKIFVQMVHHLILDNDSDHDYFLFPFDCSRKSSWRFKYTLAAGLDNYKGGRDANDERSSALKPQFQFAKEILEAMGFQCPRTKSFEADDLIGTACRKFGEQGVKCYIYSRDKDFVQCLTPNVVLIQPAQANSAERIFRHDDSDDRYVLPEQMVEYLMMVGDSSDSVKGVVGIGDKTAKLLLDNHGTIEAAREAKANKKLLAVTDDYLDMMRDLITIIDHAPRVPSTLDAIRQQRPNNKKLKKLKSDLEFDRLFHL
jgi:DNA polymerase-1